MIEAGAEFPRMLYRSGSELTVWDSHEVDTRIVNDEGELQEALSQGWSVSPEALDHDGDGKKGGSRPKLGIKIDDGSRKDNQPANGE